jgi:hypothetical protein
MRQVLSVDRQFRTDLGVLEVTDALSELMTLLKL